MSDGAPLLELEGVSKRFGPVQALDRVDFAVHAGEVVGLVGDNGAGKSTLVKGIAGTYTFDGGTYLFEGRPVHVTSPKAASDGPFGCAPWAVGANPNGYTTQSGIQSWIDALRAGDVLGREEVLGLLAQLDEVDLRSHCPHGRPVLLRMSLPEIERRFGRT